MKTFMMLLQLQFMIHVTMDVCSVSPAVKGCLGGGGGEENANMGSHTLQHQTALRRRRRTRQTSVACRRYR